MVLHQRHRGDCADFFSTPQQTGSVEFLAPIDVISEIELAAARAGRTWNDQICYIAELFQGRRPPDFDDERTEDDWRTLMSPSRVWIDKEGCWVPFTCLGERRHEHEAISETRQHAQ